LTNYGIRLSRGMAWYNAERLLDPKLVQAAASSLARSPAIAEEILDPPFFGAFVRVFRWLSTLLRRWPALHDRTKPGPRHTIGSSKGPRSASAILIHHPGAHLRSPPQATQRLISYLPPPPAGD
jgi:hypothetical protein